MTVLKISDVFQKLNFFTVCSMNMSSLPRLIPPCDSIPWVKSPGHIPHADYPLESWELGGNLRGNMSAHHVPLIRLQYTAVSELVLIDWLSEWWIEWWIGEYPLRTRFIEALEPRRARHCSSGVGDCRWPAQDTVERTIAPELRHS